MDEHYDNNLAATLLEISMEDVNENSISHIFQDNLRHTGFVVRKVSNPKSWILVRENEVEDGEVTELDFNVKGVITEKSLPPFDSQQIPSNVAKYKYLRQHLEISGMGLPTFDIAVENMAHFHGIFDRQFPEGQLEHWSPKRNMGLASIESSNRIFTPSFDAEHCVALPFPSNWDTSGNLSQAAHDKFRFCDDNLVHYYVRNVTKDYSSLIEISPVTFRIGDIVEERFTLNVVQIGRSKYRMMTTLRALILLEDTCSKRALTSRLQGSASQKSIDISVKRTHAVAMEWDISSTGKSVSRMRIKD